MADNLSRNPTAKTNTTDFVGPSWSRITGQTVGTTGRTTAARVTVGSSSYPNIGTAGAMLASSALTGGKTYSYVAWVRSSVARNVSNFLSRYNGSSFVSAAGSGVTTALAANTWTKIRGTGTVPAGGTYDRIGVHSDMPTGASGTYDIGAIRIVEGSDATIEFADGDTSGWEWLGTSGNSTSQTVAITPVPVVGAGADAAVELPAAFTRTATETNSPTSRAWTIVSGPTGSGTTIGTAAALSWTPTVVGTYVLRYTATNAGGSGTDDVTVTVTDPANTRVNYSLSPFFETGAASWYGPGASARATDLTGMDRSTGLRVAESGGFVTARWPVTPGNVYASSVQVKPTVSGSMAVGIDYYSASAYLSSDTGSVDVVNGQVTRIGLTGTAPVGAVEAVMAAVATGPMDATAHLVELAPSVGVYFDGDTPGASWDGTSGASTSRIVYSGGGASMEPGRYLLIG